MNDFYIIIRQNGDPVVHLPCVFLFFPQFLELLFRYILQQVLLDIVLRRQPLVCRIHKLHNAVNANRLPSLKSVNQISVLLGLKRLCKYVLLKLVILLYIIYILYIVINILLPNTTAHRIN